MDNLGDLNNKKVAWTNYFSNKSVIMHLMKWVQRNFLVPYFVREIKPYVKVGNKILEAGCGTAMNTIHACSVCGAEPWGLDISEKAIGEARHAANQFGADIKICLGDIRKMPFCDKSFDIVWNQGVIEHFENPVEIISEMARVGKIIFVAVPRKTLVRGLVQKVKALLGLTANDAFILYTESEIRDLMAGVKNLRIINSGSFDCLLLFSWTWVVGLKDGEGI